MPDLNYQDLKKLISDTLVSVKDTSQVINEVLKERDPLIIGAQRAEAFVILNPSHWLPFAAGAIAADEAAGLGYWEDAFIRPAENLQNVIWYLEQAEKGKGC